MGFATSNQREFDYNTHRHHVKREPNLPAETMNDTWFGERELVYLASTKFGPGSPGPNGEKETRNELYLRSGSFSRIAAEGKVFVCFSGVWEGFFH